MRILALAVALLSTMATSAFAGQPSTDAFKAAVLYTACTYSVPGTPDDGDKFIEQTCEAYLRGLTDALFFMQAAARKSIPTCMPEQSSVTVTDARRIFVSWLDAHPDQAANSAGVVAAFAILNAYRCSNSN
jgi:hypothetical protein